MSTTTNTSTPGRRIDNLRTAVGMLDAAKMELHKFTPDMDRAYDFAETAFDSIALMRIQDAAAARNVRAAS